MKPLKKNNEVWNRSKKSRTISIFQFLYGAIKSEKRKTELAESVWYALKFDQNLLFQLRQENRLMKFASYWIFFRSIV